jgi:signal peptidase I
MRITVIAALAVLVAVASTRKVLRLVQISGPSMAPALRDGDVVIGITWPRRAVLVRNAIVLAVPPGTERLIVKRLVRTSGENVSWLPINEPRSIPARHFFLVGDGATRGALEAAADSRVFGPLPADAIVARVVARVFPLPTFFADVRLWADARDPEHAPVDAAARRSRRW